MALLFTDQQIQEATGQVLAAPAKIKNLQDSRLKLVKVKQDYKSLDEANAVYTNNYFNIIQQYHNEYKCLTGAQKTDVSISSIDAAGQLSPGNVYFPISPIWTKMQPKVLDEHNGSPSSVYSGYETPKFTEVSTIVNYLKTGFTDGAITTLFTSATGSTITFTGPTTFTIGNRVVAYGSSSGFVFGTVNASTSTTVTIDVIYGSVASVASGGTVANFSNSFSLSQRENGTAAPRTQVMLGFEAALDIAVQNWESVLNLNSAALTANDATGAEATQITAAKTIVNDIITDINTWQTAPSTGTGTGRYGTLMDTKISANISARATQITSRSAEITAALGSVAQATDGTYSGSGNYYKIFDNINMRINKASGTLRNYYQQDLAMQVFDQQVATVQATATRDRQTFDVKELSADGDGSNTVKLKDVGSLSVGQSVKITSNTKPVITTTIAAINDLQVQLGASIGAEYTVSDQARLVRQS